MSEQTAPRTVHQAAARLAIVQSAAKILWRSVAVISVTEFVVMLLLQASGEPFTVWTALIDTLVLTAIALPVLNYIILRPVTQLAAQHAAATAESRFQSIAQAAQDGIVISSWDRKIRFANQAAEKMFGFPAGALEGRELDEVMPPEYVPRCREGMAGYRATGEPRIVGKGVVELEGQRQGGERFPIELSLSEPKIADEQSFVAIIRDITERKRAEEALRASERKFRELLEHLPVAVRIVRAGKLEFVNPRRATPRLREPGGRDGGRCALRSCRADGRGTDEGVCAEAGRR